MQLLTIGKVAEQLGYSRSTVRNLCNSGQLPFIRPTGPTGHRRILASDLEAYLRRFRPQLAEGDE